MRIGQILLYMQRAARYAMYCLFVAAAIVATLTVFQLVTLGLGVPQLMVVTGDSMLPALHSYDIVFLEPIKDIQVGQIVVVDYRDKNNLFSNYDYVVHRVTKLWDKEGDQYMLTQGDNAKYPEYAAKSDRAIAKVASLVSLLGFVIYPPGNFLIIGGALMALIIYKKKSIDLPK